MEQFLIDNTPRFVKLVNGFKPGATKAQAKVGADSDSDMLITARMRPLFDEEKEAGMVPAMFPRPGTDGLADIHELRRPVRGLPTLNVSRLQHLTMCMLTDMTSVLVLPG